MEVEEKTAPTSKCKGATTIPIFLKSKLLTLPVVRSGKETMKIIGRRKSHMNSLPSELLSVCLRKVFQGTCTCRRTYLANFCFVSQKHTR